MFLQSLKFITPMSYKELFSYLENKLKSVYTDVEVHNDNQSSYLYAKGTLPICVVSHLDTVHRERIKTFSITKVYSVSDKLVDCTISSPQGIGGDDRCGVVYILQLIEDGFRPSVIFTCGEETGGYGAKAFTNNHSTIDNINWFLELDRKGNQDVVCYSDDNPELTKVISKFKFAKAYGSFTDISILCPKYKISGVNLSCGYYGAHTLAEYISIRDMVSIYDRLKKILSSNYTSIKYTYKMAIYSWYDNKNYHYNDRLANGKYCICDQCHRTSYFGQEVNGKLYCLSCYNKFMDNHSNDLVTCECCSYEFIPDSSNIFSSSGVKFATCPCCGSDVELDS